MSAHQQIGEPEWVWDGCNWVRPCSSSQPRPPPWPPCPPFPPRAVQGPIAGVTNGAAARPGEVGEFVVGTATVSVVIDAAVHTYLVQPLVLSPGDWDIEATFWADGVLAEGFAMHLQPVPTGIVGVLTESLDANIEVSGQQLHARLVTRRTQGLFSVPTLLPFIVAIKNATVTGTGTLTVTARRMR